MSYDTEQKKDTSWKRVSLVRIFDITVTKTVLAIPVFISASYKLTSNSYSDSFYCYNLSSVFHKTVILTFKITTDDICKDRP